MTGTATQDTEENGTLPPGTGADPDPAAAEVGSGGGGAGGGAPATRRYLLVEEDSWNHALATYRYLRLSPVVVVLTLAVSVAMQIGREHCVLGSVSAFYYTPVHAVFIAALGLTGLALIAIRGSGPVREALLNGAGLLAPVVAFIPTARPASSASCAIDDTIGTIPQSFTGNNLTAFMVGGALLVAIALIGAAASKRLRRLEPLARKENVVPPVVVGGLLVALLAWHHLGPSSFKVHAHSYSAIALFGALGIVVALTARDEVTKSGSARATAAAKGLPVEERSMWYRWLYLACVGLMVLGVVVGVVATASHWGYTVLAVEIIETTAVLLFWATQSHDLWNVGATPEPPRPGEPLPQPPIPAAVPATAGIGR